MRSMPELPGLTVVASVLRFYIYYTALSVLDTVEIDPVSAGMYFVGLVLT